MCYDKKLQRNFSRYFNLVQTHQKKLVVYLLHVLMQVSTYLQFLFFSQTKTQKHSKVLQDFYKKLQDSGKAKLLALHRSNLREPNFDYVRLLAELGQEQGFEITYVDIFQVYNLVMYSGLKMGKCNI